jgi:hypothetical protein
MPTAYFIVNLMPPNSPSGTTPIKDIFFDSNFNLASLASLAALNPDYLKNLYVERIAPSTPSGGIPWEGYVWSKS